MTNNTASANINAIQRDLSGLYQVAAAITATADNLSAQLQAVKTQVEALETAPAPQNGAQQALALINAFKAAQGQPVASATPLPGFTPEVLQAVSPASAVGLQFSTLSGLDLTNQARKLLRSGRTYTQTINDLIQANPGRPREQIRRAVGRANGGAR